MSFEKKDNSRIPGHDSKLWQARVGKIIKLRSTAPHATPSCYHNERNKKLKEAKILSELLNYCLKAFHYKFLPEL